MLKIIKSHLSNSLKFRRTMETQRLSQEEIDVKNRIFVIIPILFIALAEFLISAGKIELAIWIHILIIIALSISHSIIKDLKIHKIFLGLILLPTLRLIDLSMPIFFENTPYTFIFIYGALIIPVATLLTDQLNPFEESWITKENFLPYTIIAVFIGLLLGFQTQYLNPYINFENLLDFTVIIIFLTALIEELIFRTILQTRLENFLGVKEAIVITGLLFGIMHSSSGNFYEVFYASFIGLIMGFIFYMTKNLLFIVIVHGFILPPIAFFVVTKPGLIPPNATLIIFALTIFISLREIFSCTKKWDKYINVSFNLAIIPLLVGFLAFLVSKIMEIF
jgi:uncharacterized protein